MPDDVVTEQSHLPGIDAGKAPRDLAARPEDQWFERKSGRIAARELANVLVGFANAEGGTVVVGVGDDGGIEGVAASGKVNEWRQAARTYTEPPVRHSIQLIDCTNAGGEPDHLAVFEVEPSEQVHSNVRGETFLRVGDSTRKIGPAEAQELRYDKGESSFDGRRTAEPVSAFDAALVDSYCERVGASRPEEALMARGLAMEQREGRRATVAGLLLLGRKPQIEFPQAFVRVLRYEGTGRETGARANVVADRRLEGSLTRQIEGARSLVREWLPTAIRLGEEGRFREMSLIPEAAWLEAIVNAVTHRSYSLGGDHVRVSLFSDRVEVESPGRLPGLVRVENIRRTRFARNPRIARGLSDFGYARELGEGVNRMFEEMRGAGLPVPHFDQGPASVRVSLRADRLQARMLEELPAGAERFAEFLAREGRVTTAGARDLLGVSKPTALRYLRRLAQSGFIERVGSTYDPTAYWRLIQ